MYVKKGTKFTDKHGSGCHENSHILKKQNKTTFYPLLIFVKLIFKSITISLFLA